MRILLSSFVVLLCLVNVVQAEWLPITSDTPAPPQISVVEANSDHTILRIELAGLSLTDTDWNGHTALSIPSRFGVRGLQHTSQPGAPALPMISEWVAIPPRADVEISVRAELHQTLTNIDVLPYSDYIEPEKRYIDPVVYQADAQFPEALAQADAPQIMRDVRFVPVQIFPVQVNPAQREVSIYSVLEIEIRTSGSNGINPKTNIAPPSATFEKFYQKRIINYNLIKPYLFGSTSSRFGGIEGGLFSNLREPPEGLDLLIISPDALVGALDEFVDWKNQKGIRTYVAPFSEAGDSRNEIKDYIQEVYDDPETRPEFILFIGDANVCPAWTSTGYLSDNPYGYLEGNDEKLDVFLGRFPCTNSPLSLLTMVNRTLEYEQTPVRDESHWQHKATMICPQESSWETKFTDITQNLLIDIGDYEEIDEHWDYGDTEEIIEILNTEGRAFVNYRGYISDYGILPDQVDPLGKYPFITWLTCGKCNYSSNDFCVRWMRDGSADYPEGAIGVVAGSQVTNPEPYARRRDSLDRGMYEAVFLYDLFTMGEILVWGKETVVRDYPLPDIYTEDTYNHFSLMGDPTAEIWTYIPQDVTVEHDNIFLIGSSELTVHVENNDGEPLIGATVAVTNAENDVFFKSVTDGNGDCTLQLEVEEMGTYDLTVTTHNYVPYTGTVEALSGEYFEGTITNSQNGNPVPAEVSIEEGYSTIADEETGYYRLYVPGAGNYVLNAERWGYESYQSETLTIGVGEAMQHDFQMEPYPAGTIRGYVSNTSDVSIEGVRVIASSEGIDQPPAITNAEGYYEISCPGSYTYNVHTRNDGYEIRNQLVSLNIEETIDLDFQLADIQSFEESNGGFYEFPESDCNGGCDWEHGIPFPEGGPEQAYLGQNVWGTSLSGFYPPFSNSYLITPTYHLIMDPNLETHLHVHHWYEIAEGVDGGHVRITTDGGTTWSVLPPVNGYSHQSITSLAGEPGFSGYSNGWRQVRFDLSPYMGQRVQFQFRFASTVASENRGWFIDRFVVYGRDVTVGINPNNALEHIKLPARVVLSQNYPNPFNPQTAISYQLPEKTTVQLHVYDVMGRQIRTLVNESNQQAGIYTLVWDGTNEDGQTVPSGIYFYSLQTDTDNQTKRMLLLK